MEDNKELQEQEVKIESNQNTINEEQEERKPSFWVLLIGIFLIVRGIMRYSEGELGGLGIVMIAIGIINVIYFLAKRM